MTDDHAHHGQTGERRGSFFSARANIVLVGFLAIAGYFLITEHYAHIVPFLPWLLLLACPLMHLFMHGGHGGHHSDAQTGDSAPSGRQNPPLQRRSDLDRPEIPHA